MKSKKIGEHKYAFSLPEDALKSHFFPYCFLQSYLHKFGYFQLQRTVKFKNRHTFSQVLSQVFERET